MEDKEVARLRVNDVVKKKTIWGVDFFLVVEKSIKGFKLSKINKSKLFKRKKLFSSAWKKSSAIELIPHLK